MPEERGRKRALTVGERPCRSTSALNTLDSTFAETCGKAAADAAAKAVSHNVTAIVATVLRPGLGSSSQTERTSFGKGSATV